MGVTTWGRALRQRHAGSWVARGIVISAAAGFTMTCSKSPVTPSGAVTLATPALLAPANGSQIANAKQPVTLTVNNAFVSDSSSAAVYTFEVATDSGFVGKVQTATASPGTGGQTSVVLGTLVSGQSYFWHVRATAGGTVGTFSAPGTFSIGPLLGLAAPVVVAPLNGATPTGWPTFVISDSTRTGPVGQITYRFDVSTTSTFASLVVSGTVTETNGQTSFTPSYTTPVPAGVQLFWRATAIDTSDSVTSASSTTQAFTPSAPTQQVILAAELGQTLWPGNQPTGANGQAVLGTSCDGSPNWGLATCFSPLSNGLFQAPTIEALRFFDLFDRGYDPQSAINWMNANGYPTAAQWYPPPEKAVLGLGLFYLAARGKVVGPGTIWDIVIGLG